MKPHQALIVAFVFTPTVSQAEILRCKIDGIKEIIYIATAPDTNSQDGDYARIGVSPGVGNRAYRVSDRMGATAYVELNADGTPVGLITVQKNMGVIRSSHAIDPFGTVLSPSQNKGVCNRCDGVSNCIR
ncbi:hypothetical protein [Bradyrhizobium sp. TM233]|uniref:hypothetical protein n=1 Tax=Bradyrhizobium sp. TM233 TaxID=2599801 RepID=UPI0027D5D591|nr:hypothetical protein TM233_27910 [Bradyrhizobium sp. TM233]